MTTRLDVARFCAGSASLLSGVGFGLPCAAAIGFLARTGEVWQFLGFPTYGNGPFERVGIHTSIPLLAIFLAVCLAETALAGLIWTAHPAASRFGFCLLPMEFVFWVGFALPVGPPLGVTRTLLIGLASTRPAAASPNSLTKRRHRRCRAATGVRSRSTGEVDAVGSESIHDYSQASDPATKTPRESATVVRSSRLGGEPICPTTVTIRLSRSSYLLAISE